MAGSRIPLHFKAFISFALIIIVFLLDDHFIGSYSHNTFWVNRIYLHMILAMTVVGLIGSFTYLSHPIKWTLNVWILCYVAAICALLVNRTVFLFVKDIYFVQNFVIRFIEKYLFSPLPFLGLYALAEIIKPKKENS